MIRKFLKKNKIYIFLHMTLFLYALTSLVAKCASQFQLFSIYFNVLYCINILLLFIYAIFWQQVLKQMDLNLAYASKSITVLWGGLFGFLFFGEVITFSRIVAMIMIMCGIILVGRVYE